MYIFLYIFSISYKKFEKYVEGISNADKRFFTVSLPYHFGVRNGFVTPEFIEQYIEDNRDENPELIKAELLGIPERGSGEGFFKFEQFNKNRKLKQTFVVMSDNEFIEYRDNKSEWEHYIPREEGEIRVLSMDIASTSSARSDNTIFWVTRNIPNKSGTYYETYFGYGESMAGINITLQTLRAKQLFYEMECDYFVVDTGGVGITVADDAMHQTFDPIRGVTYPAWKFYNEEGSKDNSRCLDEDALPLMYAIVPSPKLNHKIYTNAKSYLDKERLQLPVLIEDAMDYLNKEKHYYKIDDSDLKRRLLEPYMQTNLLIRECINLERSTAGAVGYLKLENKSTKRKDRMSSFCYNLWMCRIIEDLYILENKEEETGLLDYILYA